MRVLVERRRVGRWCLAVGLTGRPRVIMRTLTHVPAIVGTRCPAVDLLPVVLADVVYEDVAGARLNGEFEGVAQAQSPDRPVTARSRGVEGVVGGDGAGTVFSTVFLTVTVRAGGVGGAACSRLPLPMRPRKNPKSSPRSSPQRALARMPWPALMSYLLGRLFSPHSAVPSPVSLSLLVGSSEPLKPVPPPSSHRAHIVHAPLPRSD